MATQEMTMRTFNAITRILGDIADVSMILVHERNGHPGVEREWTLERFEGFTPGSWDRYLTIAVANTPWYSVRSTEEARQQIQEMWADYRADQ